MKRNQFIKWLCFVWSVCLVLSMLPPLSLAEELPATAQSDSTVVQSSADVAVEEVATAPAQEPTAALVQEQVEAPAQEPTVEPMAEPMAEPTAKPTAEPEQTIVGFEPVTYALTAAYGAALEELGLPAEVTALLSDGTSAEVPLVWSCASYNPQHGRAEAVSYTFTAALAEDTYACQAALPTAVVTVAAAPAMPMLGTSNDGNYSPDIMEAYSPASPVHVAVAREYQQVIELTAGAQDGVYGEGGASVTFTAGEPVGLVDIVVLSVLRDSGPFDPAGMWSCAGNQITFAPVLAGTYTVTPVLTAGSEAEYVLTAESATVTVNRAAAPLAVSVDQEQYDPGDTVQVTLAPQSLAGDDELVINEVWACSVGNENETAHKTYPDGLALTQKQTLTLTLPDDAYGDWQVQVDYAVWHGGEDRTGCYESAQMPTFDVQGTIPVEMEADVHDGEYGSAGVYFGLQNQAGLSITDFSLNITRNGEPYEFENEAWELQYDEASGKCDFIPMNVGTFEVEIVSNKPQYVVMLAPQTFTVTPVTLLTIEPDSSTVKPGEAITGEMRLDSYFFEIFQAGAIGKLESITVWAENGNERTGQVVYSIDAENISETMAFSIPLVENATPGTWIVYAQAQVKHVASGQDVSDCYAVSTASVQVEGAEPEYTLVIPASVTLDDDGTGSLQLSCKQMQNAVSVQVTVASQNGFMLRDSENAIAYTLSGESGTIQNGGLAATFTGTGSADLSLAVTQGVDPAPGTYTDILTFTASAE